MQILMMLFAVFFAMGLFFILADLLKIPSLAAEKAMLSAVKESSQKTKNIEVLLNGFAVRIAKYLPIDEYKKIRMRNTLNAAGMKETPEEFMANAFVKSGAVLLGVIPALVFFPLLAPVVLILAVIVYFKEIRRADEKLNAKREKIEIELPRFVATVTQELKASRDVLSILENFKKNAGADFAKELDIVTADMRSSSYEAALTRFEARINSTMLSDITRGLIGVLRGDDGAMYFQMLSHDMKQLELQRLKAQAMKIPSKIRIFSFLMLMCFLMTYIVIIISEIIHSLSTML
ncbi:MAG: secretion protein F [Oscillospiraceae bacterium]|jgi:tight adherence protein C|nr:secretion protein F [Oscillospiraceae bacterium]